MLLQVIVIFFICLSNALAEKNFWNNEICSSDNDCSGLTSCDATFGCTLSVAKVGFVMFGVFLLIILIMIVSACLCTRHIRNNRFRSNTHYVHPVPVIATTSPPWNQQGYSYPYPNQMYANAGNSNNWNQHQMSQATTVNPPHYNQYPIGHTTAPDVGFGYKHSTQQTHYSKQ